MTFGTEVLKGDLFEHYKSQVDAAQTTEELAKTVASISNPDDREKVMYAAARRHALMLTRKIDELLKNKN